MNSNLTTTERILAVIILVLVIYSGWLAYRLQHEMETKQAVIDMYNSRVELGK